MAYILQIVSGKDVQEIEFPARPVFADVDSAIRSLSIDVAKYVDEEGDLCSLSKCTFDDFLSVAQQQEADRTVLRIQLPADILREPSKFDEFPPSPSASQCSSISADWTMVGQDIVEDPRDSDVQSTSDMQSDTVMHQESQAIVDEASFDPKCDGSQALISADGRNASDAISYSLGDRQVVPEAAETLEPICSAATPPLETEMPTPASASNVELSAVHVLSGHSGMASEHGDEPFDADTHGVEAPAAPDDNGVPLRQQPCPCKVCCNPMSLHLPAPFKSWLCDICDRSFAQPDPMWACPIPAKCNWGICMDCHEHLQDQRVGEQHAETWEPCEQHTSSNSVVPLLAVGAVLLGAPLLSVALAIAAKRQRRRSNRLCQPSSGHS